MSSVESPGETQPSTRARLVDAALTLFRRHGYAATGVKAVLSAAKTPYGSLYHWFPGGKQELGVAAVAQGGARYLALLGAHYPPGVDVVEATAASFVAAATLLEATDYTDACPIASIALEVASTDEPMRIAAAAAFESWLELIAQRLMEAGMSSAFARETAVEIFCLIEGAALLSQTTRSPEALHIAGRCATRAVMERLAANRETSKIDKTY